MSPAETAPRTRQRARKGEGDKLRDEILDAAEGLLQRTGSRDAVSIRMITDVVGCTAPSIYRHFEDKSTLIYCVCDRLFEEMHTVFEEACRGIDDPLEALCAVGHAYLDFGIRNPEAYRVMFLTSDSGEPHPLAPRTLEEAEETDPAFGAVVRIVRAAFASGGLQMPGQDPLRVAVDLWTMVHGVTVFATVGDTHFPYPDPHEELDRLFGLMLDAYSGAPEAP